MSPLCSLYPLPFKYPTLWNETAICSPHIRSRKLWSIVLTGKCLQKLFRFLQHRKYVYSPHLFTFSIIYIIQILDIHLINLIIIQYRLFYCSNYFSSSHWEIFYLPPISLWHIPLSCSLRTSLLLSNTKCSRLGTIAVPALDLESGIYFLNEL